MKSDRKQKRPCVRAKSSGLAVSGYLAVCRPAVSGRGRYTGTAGDQSYDELFRLLPYKRASHIPSETQGAQNEVKDLIENVLDILPEEPVQKKLVDYARERRPRRNRLVAMFRFSKLTTTFEQVDEGHFAEVLRPNSIDEIIEFFVRACVHREQRFRVCKNHGKYFALSGYTNTEYCDRPYENTGKTCKEIGALNTWQKKRTENPVINAYSNPTIARASSATDSEANVVTVR